jgi:hypothetical protein
MRIKPVTAPYEPDVEARLRKWMRPGSAVEPLALFRVLVRNRRLSERMLGLGAYFLSPDSGLSMRDRAAPAQPSGESIVIDRVCARCHCEYEWGVHAAAFASEARFTEAQLNATVSGDAAVWNEREQLLIRMVDALHDAGQIPVGLWSGLAVYYNDEQLLTLVALAGGYHVVSFLANSTGIPREPWARFFPEQSR